MNAQVFLKSKNKLIDMPIVRVNSKRIVLDAGKKTITKRKRDVRMETA